MIGSVLRTYFGAGGLHLQLSAVDTHTLLDAQANPERYQGLVVRVSSWSTRFVELARDAQDILIGSAEHRL